MALEGTAMLAAAWQGVLTAGKADSRQLLSWCPAAAGSLRQPLLIVPCSSPHLHSLPVMCLSVTFCLSISFHLSNSHSMVSP